MRYFRIAKWKKFQHYHKPRPAWVKLYTKINDPDQDWEHLPDHVLGQLIRIMAHAALMDNILPFDELHIKNVCKLHGPAELVYMAQVGVIEVFDDYQQLVNSKNSRERSREKPIVPSSEIRDQRSEDREDGNPKKDSLSSKAARRKAEKAELEEKTTEVIQYFIEVSGKTKTKVYADSNRKFVRARLNEGTTVEDLKAVVDLKARQVAAGEFKELYFRIETLFNATKCQSYLGEIESNVVAKEAKRPMTMIEREIQLQKEELK